MQEVKNFGLNSSAGWFNVFVLFNFNFSPFLVLSYLPLEHNALRIPLLSLSPVVVARIPYMS
jgi:hypothetical protein